MKILLSEGNFLAEIENLLPNESLKYLPQITYIKSKQKEFQKWINGARAFSRVVIMKTIEDMGIHSGCIPKLNFDDKTSRNLYLKIGLWVNLSQKLKNNV